MTLYFETQGQRAYYSLNDVSKNKESLHSVKYDKMKALRSSLQVPLAGETGCTQIVSYFQVAVTLMKVRLTETYKKKKKKKKPTGNFSWKSDSDDSRTVCQGSKQRLTYPQIMSLVVQKLG